MEQLTIMNVVYLAILLVSTVGVYWKLKIDQVKLEEGQERTNADLAVVNERVSVIASGMEVCKLDQADLRNNHGTTRRDVDTLTEAHANLERNVKTISDNMIAMQTTNKLLQEYLSKNQ